MEDAIALALVALIKAGIASAEEAKQASDEKKAAILARLQSAESTLKAAFDEMHSELDNFDKGA